MSMLITSTGGPWPMPPWPVRRFTVDEYHRMIQAGILSEDEPVELLEGWITPQMARNPPHDITVDLVPDVLRPRLPAGWRVRAQLAITTADSEPEPDVAAVPGPASRYAQRHPTPAEVGLLVEVADATLQRDRTEKARLYARARIGCYWIINIPDRQIEVYTDPTGPDPSPHYRSRTDFRDGDAVPLVIDGHDCGSIPVADLLPPPQ